MKQTRQQLRQKERERLKSIELENKMFQEKLRKLECDYENTINLLKIDIKKLSDENNQLKTENARLLDESKHFTDSERNKQFEDKVINTIVNTCEAIDHRYNNLVNENFD